MIQNAMKDIHYSVVFNKSAKQQALDVIKKLKAVMPITRASMLLRVVYGITAHEDINSYLSAQKHSVTLTGTGKMNPSHENSMLYIDMKCDPEVFRKLGEIIKDMTNGEGRVEVLQLQVASGQLQTSSTSSTVPEAVSSTLSSSVSSSSSRSGVGSEFSKSDESDLSLRTMLGMKIVDDNTTDRNDIVAAAHIANKKKKSARKDKKSAAALYDISENNELVDIDNDEDSSSDVSTVESDVDTAPLSRDTSQASSASLVTHPEKLLPDGRPKGVRIGKNGGNKKEKKEKNQGNMTNAIDGGTRGGGDKKGKKSKRRELEEQQARKEKVEDLKKRFVKEQENLARQRGEVTSSSASTDEISVPDGENEKLKLEYSKKGINLVFVDPFAVDVPPPVPMPATVTNAPPPTAPSTAPETLTRSVFYSVTKVEKSGQKCNTCGGNFPDAAAYRAHFKSEWHRHNLKLKMKGEPIIPSEELSLELAPEEVIVDEMVGH